MSKLSTNLHAKLHHILLRRKYTNRVPASNYYIFKSSKKRYWNYGFSMPFQRLGNWFWAGKGQLGHNFSPFSSQSFTLFSKMWLVFYNCWLATFACPVYVALHQYFCLSKHQNLNILNVCIVILTVSCNILQNLSNEI